MSSSTDYDFLQLVVYFLGVVQKLIGNTLPISVRVSKVDLVVNLGYIAGLMLFKP